jgi:putative flavoprotein involved in K+ transport
VSFIIHQAVDRRTHALTRTPRWRSFRIVSPNSLNPLPGFEYDGPEPDAFLDTDGILAYLEGYAASFAAPIRPQSPVGEVRPAAALTRRARRARRRARAQR